MKTFIYIFLLATILASCKKDPQIDNATMLDGDQIFDLSLTHPENYLLSKKFPVPTAVQLNTPVIILAHGYSASTFEWDELKTYAESKGTMLTSQVLLGGHGGTYEAFKDATWQGWQRSIRDEYNELVALGYKKIFLAGSSTGGALILNLVKTGFFNNAPPKGIFLIDPIIVPSNKSLTLVGTAGPIIGFSTTKLSTGEKGHWYVYRPYQTLKQLMEIINTTRIDLQKGFSLPLGTFMKTYKSKVDDSADPVSAVLIYKGIKTATGGKTDLELVDSKLHVFTRLSGRDGVTAADAALQQKTFAEMEYKMTH